MAIIEYFLKIAWSYDLKSSPEAPYGKNFLWAKNWGCFSRVAEGVVIKPSEMPQNDKYWVFLWNRLELWVPIFTRESLLKGLTKDLKYWAFLKDVRGNKQKLLKNAPKTNCKTSIICPWKLYFIHSKPALSIFLGIFS